MWSWIARIYEATLNHIKIEQRQAHELDRFNEQQQQQQQQ